MFLQLEDKIPSKGALGEISNFWVFEFPPCVREFYAKYSEGSGWLGERYIRLWCPGEIAELNLSMREEAEELQEVLFFADNGSSERFGFACRNANDFVFVVSPNLFFLEDVLQLGNEEQFREKFKSGGIFDEPIPFYEIE